MNLHTAGVYGKVIHDRVEFLSVLAEKEEKRRKDEEETEREETSGC